MLKTNDPKLLTPQGSPTNDITAFSQTSPDLSGTIAIARPEVDPNRGLMELASRPPDVKVAQDCQPRTAANRSSFTIIGSGGLPPNPQHEPFTSDAILVEWVDLNRHNRDRVINTVRKMPTSKPIVEATGWVRNSFGEVLLIGQGVQFNNPPLKCPNIRA